MHRTVTPRIPDPGRRPRPRTPAPVLRGGAVLALLLVLCTAAGLRGQTFGKNKVQYTPFSWSYIQSSHFDVYFPQEGYPIATFTARAAEEALADIQRDFRYRITARIPIVVYTSHNDFQQTNVVDEYMEEGIGGVTELFKNRVVIPFEGSYRAFQHVLHHELVHAVLNDMFYGGSIQAAMTNRIALQLPLWANEGMAEYQSRGGWDKDSDMFIRDAVTSNYLPPVEMLGGYFAYRGGQSVWWYIAEKYGEQKVGEVLNAIRSTRSLDGGLKASIGLTVKELSERWQREMKRIYYPDVAKREAASDFARRLTNHNDARAFYNTSPAFSPNGDRLAFISNRTDYFGVYVMSAVDGSGVDRIIEGSNTSDFEELHLLTPGITWSPDGRRIAVAAKAGADDAIMLVDVETGGYEQLPVEKDGIYSVQFSPDGRSIAFVGNSATQSDIWVYDVDAKTARKITDDIFSDASPSWSPDSRTIYFVSDRRQYVRPGMLPADFDMLRHDYTQQDIFRVDVASGEITRITDTPEDESYPLAGPDGRRMLFISERNGIGNVYVMDLETHATHPITNSLTGIYQIALSQDGSKLAFSSMFEAGFDIFLLKSPFERPSLGELEPTEYLKRLQRAAELPIARAEKTRKAGGAARIDSLTIASLRAEPDTALPSSQMREAETIRQNSDTEVRVGRLGGSGETQSDSAAPPAPITASSLGGRPEGAPAVFSPRNNLAPDGSFVIHKYKLGFTTDLVYGNAGFSTFYGVSGTIAMSFSDMLGDHRILLVTNLVGDLKNSDYALAYQHLPDRLDWSLQGFHSARYLYGASSSPYYANLYRYRQWGFGLSMQYPLDKFNRLQGSATWMTVTEENMDDPNWPTESNTLIVSDIGYVHDNTIWGMWAPVRGKRYELHALGSPGAGASSLQFLSLTADYRKYFKFWDDYSFVIRGAAGASFGQNKQLFYIGGTENWVNRVFATGYVPINSPGDFAFMTPVLPLRGFLYNQRIAPRYVLTNFELRFPLVRYFLGGFLPFLLNSVTAVAFLDAGGAFDNPTGFRAYQRQPGGGYIANDLLIGTGVGARVWFLGLPWRFDVGWGYNGRVFLPPIYYLSLGGDF